MIRIPKYSSPALALLAVLPLPARPDADAPDERFGVMTHFAHGWDPGMIPLIARSGVSSVRDELYWREVEPQKGAFSFPNRHDVTMAALAKNNLSPFVVLSFENNFYDEGATPYTEEGIAGFARYGAEVLNRYGKQIKAVEVWNEYNGTFAHGPVESDRAGNYLRMLRTTFTALKRAQPDVTVVGGATAGVPLPYWEKLLAGGALAYMDALSVHPYRYDSPPEGLETDMAELAALVAKYNGGQPKPIWVSEIGWQSHASSAPGDLAVDDQVQAKFLVRAYALLFSAGVQRVYWYLFRDDQEFKMGLVREDGTTKPAFAAMSTMTRQLQGARFVEREPTPPDLYSMRFRRDSGDDVRVIWSLQPGAVKVSGVTGAIDLFGRTLPTSDMLQLSDSPIFVTGTVIGLPRSVGALITEARQGFSETQGKNGWSYGCTTEESGAFVNLPTCTSDDWHASWQGEQPYLAITSRDQHPSVQNGQAVAAVRRWQSDRAGRVRVSGSFRGGSSGGDGVGVSIAVNGQRRFRKLLGGGTGNPVAENFDFIETVAPGSTIDFAVDPGPAANIDHDSTTVSVAISTTP